MHLAGFLSTTGYVIEVLIGVSLIIFVHELGHFLAAKWAGVKVRRFFFGFAPVIKIGGRKITLQFFAIDYKGTKYGLGMLPFGGFVDMAGEFDGKESPDVPQKQLFNTKTPGQRAIIFVAGAAMNAIFAIVFFVVAFAIGVSFVRPTVGDVAVGGPAWQAGIRPGDTILEINGEKQSEFTEMLMIIALADQDTKLNMKIQRGGEVFETQVTPLVDPRGRGMTIGIMTNAEPVIQYVQPDSPAFEAGLKSGDRITHVEYTDPETQQTVRTAVNSYRDVTTIVQNPKLIGKQVTLEVLRGDPEQPEKLRLTVVPEIPETAPKLIGIAALSTRIDAIRNGSKAAGKFQVNDIILTTDGAEVYSLAELRKTAFEKDKLPLTLRVEREGATREVSVSGIDLANWIDDEISFNAVSMEKIPPVAGDIQAGMPATLAGMRPGDLITHMDGRQVAVFEEIRAAIRAKRGEPVEVTWSRKKPDGTMETQTAALTPAPQRIGYIGVMYRQDRFILRKGFFGAIATGFRRTILWGERVFLIIKGLFTRDISPKNLAGPVGIFTISYAVTQFGIGTLLYFLAMISINLAIINVFPVPVLDGGHLLFLGIEKVKGSPVALKTQVAAQTVGLVLLLSMAIFVTYNDIARLIWGM